ncbi:MAG TPA: aldolase/citrate lyase family protein [Intrasporangium sp.]|uniref:HpcH/HpaI aldolase family protein n=1 Tax=Intrasporangium sp. TaxID=1925024 RepID=UPI002D780B1E|nr:aldolase/citrate lyase family protein [Intrasporangium sp.]HET7397845.1 aldolase/citrate lyase family protein [Intrasporangium sp.]
MSAAEGRAAEGRVADFARRVRARETLVGYWVVLDSPVSTERLARVGYDYVCLDAQHGLLDYKGILAGMMAVDAGGASVGLVRVGANDPFLIGQSLDAGAAGVIVPLVNTPEDAARAVAATRYPPVGVRSYGPMRSALRIGPTPAESNDSTVVLAMIETPQGLDNVEAICATPGLDGIYIGPSDLRLAVGGSSPTDASVDDAFEAAAERICVAAREAGVTAGFHTAGGQIAAKRLGQGFTLATVSADLVHLEQAAATHLRAARGQA